MTYDGNSQWPPLWSQRRGDTTETLEGEIGVLRNVHYSDPAAARLCYLINEQNGDFFIGTLRFDNPINCSEVSRLLHMRIGQTIREIGDLDLPRQLSE